MSTNYKAQIDTKGKSFTLSFETDDIKLFKLVENICRKCYMKGNKAVKAEKTK